MSLASAEKKSNYVPGPALQLHLIPDLPTEIEIRPYLERIDAHRWYTNFGPLVREFEQKMTALLSAADPNPQNGPIHLTTMTSCYLALEIGLQLLGIQPGGKVLVPAVTFPGCAQAVKHAGGEVLFADVDATNWVLTPEIARRAAEKTKLDAVMPTALYGIPLSVAEWDEFSRDTEIPVIIDAAAAVENQAILHHGLVAHSLHATKPFGVGEGGLLVSRDPEIIQRARSFSNFGTIERITQTDGVNAKMSEYHAAAGLAQVSRWTAIKQKRQAMLELYCLHLKVLKDAFSLHPAIDEAVPSLLMLRFDKLVSQDQITSTIADGIALHRTYLPPLYRHPYFGSAAVINESGEILTGDVDANKKASHMPNSEMLNRHLVGVPFHPFLSEDDIAFVTDSLQQLAVGL